MERNAAVEDTYDVVFDWNREWAGAYWRSQSDLRQSILDGDEYDIIEGVSLYQAPQLVYGCYYDLVQNEYIDLSQPRWDGWILETAVAGYQYIARDENGKYVITGITDDLLDMSDKVRTFINSTENHFSRYTYKVHPSYPAAVDAEGKPMFCNNQILFMLEGISWTSSEALRNFGSYGILPAPKYVESQENYGASTSPFVCAVCTTTGDLKISSIIFEALQMESYKYLSDPQAVAMLNYIFANLNTDWCYNFAQAGIPNLCIAMPTEEYLGSYFQKNSAAIEQKLADFLSSVDAMP